MLPPPVSAIWQPMLAAFPAADAYRVFLRALEEGRPSTVYTYYLEAEGRPEAVAVGTISPRVARYLPEDGIPVLGRSYVRQEYRGRGVYASMLQHRLQQCVNEFGRHLLGVHMGTSSRRVETVFRTIFPGRVIRIGNEDLGNAGVVAALLGMTVQSDLQVALPVPTHLRAEHRLLRAFLANGANAVSVAQAKQASRALADCHDVYRVLDQFLHALTDLH